MSAAGRAAAGDRPLVVVTVGTDHHRFDRLTDWLEPWIARHEDVQVVHQHGSSRPARGASAVGVVGREVLLSHLSDAVVVVSQGGPGSILDARTVGRVPVVVPRVPHLDEVVDEHQLRFTRRLADLGWVRLVQSAQELESALDEALESPERFRCPPHHAPVADTAKELARLLDEVTARPPGFVSWHRLRQVLAHHRRRSRHVDS